MNQMQIPKTDVANRSAYPESDAWKSISILLEARKKIAVATSAGLIISAGICLALPDVYQASTKLLPPQQTQSTATALLSQLGGLAGAAAGAAGLKNPSDLYIGMLRSRTVADKLIKRFNLKTAYETNSDEQARKQLMASTSIMAGKDSLISIAVDDENKKLVAPLANAYAEELFILMKTLAVTDASQRRLFYERELDNAKNNLSKAELSLRKAIETHGVISVDTESRAIVETIAMLRARVSAKEIQLSSMRAFMTDSNPESRRVVEELNGLRLELAKLENGRGIQAAGPERNGGLENIKLLRELKYQQMLYEVLAKQYEIARLDEARDPSIIQVLDQAIEPERRSKPRRILIVALSTIFAFFAASGWVLLTTTMKRNNHNMPKSVAESVAD